MGCDFQPHNSHWKHIRRGSVAGGKEGKMKRKVPVAVTVVLLVLAIASCVFGVQRGELKTVSKKAYTVCLECIGIG